MSGFDTLLASTPGTLADHARVIGLPTARVEAWKYMPTRGLIKTAWSRATVKDTSSFALSGGHFLNPPETVVGDRQRCTALESKRLERLLSAQGFSQHHRALEAECLVVEVPKAASAHWQLTRMANGADTAGFATLVIRVGAGATLKLSELFEHADATAPNLDSLAMVLVLERDARVEHTRFQAANAGAYCFTAIDVTAHEHGHYRAEHVDFGAKLARTDLTVTLAGREASTVLLGLALTSGRQYHDTHLSVDHAVGHTRSQMAFRTLVDDQGEATFNGRVLIQKDAQKSATEQSVANLLLSEKGRINPKPELEIYADDVTASHGCTVGNLNQTALFYLRSRGLSESDAKAFLQYAFAEEIVSEIQDPQIAQAVEDYLLGALQQGELIAELKESLDV